MEKYRILLVGGAGTLGSDILAANLPNFTFFVVDDFKESALTEIEVSKYCEYKNTNAANKESIREVFSRFKPNVIVYLATTLSGDQNRALESNVLGLKNVILEASVDNHSHIVYIQSFLTRKTNDAINEKTAIQARDSYSTWKLAGEFLLASYAGKRTTIILSSVISPHLSVGAIPHFIKLISRNQPVVITDTYRDYLDPNSFIEALQIVITDKLDISEVVIGSGSNTSTENILSEVANCLGKDLKNIQFKVTEPKATDPKKIVLDFSLFQSITGWKPSLTLRDEISAVIKNLETKELKVRLHH
jgi:nucleoside-diphosphate-sugar epimerase